MGRVRDDWSYAVKRAKGRHFLFPYVPCIVLWTNAFLWFCVSEEKCRSFIELSPPAERGKSKSPYLTIAAHRTSLRWGTCNISLMWGQQGDSPKSQAWNPEKGKIFAKHRCLPKPLLSVSAVLETSSHMKWETSTASREMSTVRELIFFFCLVAPILHWQRLMTCFYKVMHICMWGVLCKWQINLGHSWHNSRVEKPHLLILLGNSMHTIQILLVYKSILKSCRSPLFLKMNDLPAFTEWLLHLPQNAQLTGSSNAFFFFLTFLCLISCPGPWLCCFQYLPYRLFS